jgi:hypothetical protein
MSFFKPHKKKKALSKVSLITVGMQTVMDAYLCMLHFASGGLIGQLFLPFVSAAFFKFVLFAIFEMRYLLEIARAQRRNQDDAALGTMYSRFCMFLLLLYGRCLFFWHVDEEAG